MKMHMASGFLKAEDIDPVEGTKVKIYKEAVAEDIEFEGRDGNTVETTIWNVKVKMPDGTKRLCKIGGESQKFIKDAFGDESREWIGHTLKAVIQKKKFGDKLAFMPTDDPKNMEGCEMPMSEDTKKAIEEARENEANGETAGAESEADKIPF